MDKTYAGFGFGPIQSGLFLFEAQASGNFSRYTVAEVDADLVRAVGDNGGRYVVNVAHPDRIEAHELAGIELLNPTDPDDRDRLIDALADAGEIATCLPSVAFYDRGGDTSVARLLGEALGRADARRPKLIYASENHNHAAEFLTEKIADRHPDALTGLEVVNTVIGKMSGVITDPAVIHRLGLTTITPAVSRAVLVEEFNRILISRVTLEGFRRGIDVFEEKDDLLPFEEAKLYGHNAIHAMIAYLAEWRGLETIADAGHDEQIMAWAREAFLAESGRALIARHAALGDPLFTSEGYRAYADDLLERMVNPNLNDLVERVGRDHLRKLGYDDRLYGTMRIALTQGIRPERLALGAAAGVASLIRRADEIDDPPASLPGGVDELTRDSLDALLRDIWSAKAGRDAPELIDLTWSAMGDLRALSG
jgi:mannitol-1-phosphate 5-dehydrogenase